ncbi:major facilitator superfamily domain-containing protein [Mycena polygramma]|nr:major facilitator superfamily domain-containing protein [Mycena polygramma]
MAHPMDTENSTLSTQPTQFSDRAGAAVATEKSPEAETNTQGFQLALITFALCLSVFLVALDNTIIATALPRITDYFNSLDDVGWYASAYLLTTASFQLLFGKFYSFLSIKWVYLSAIFTFELGSLVSGIAPTSDVLIIGRAISGLGSAGIFSGALIIVSNVVPLRRRPLYTGLVGSMYGVASVAGPLTGGAFTDKLTWRWCFWINLPIGAMTLVIMTFFFKTPPEIARAEDTSFAKRFQRLDPWGTVIFVGAVSCCLLALQWAGTKYPWNSGRIIALLVIFSILSLVFIGIQIASKPENATISPRIFMQRSILAGAWYSFFAGSGYYILVYFLPLWFQAIQGVSAVKSGTENLGMILSFVVATILAGCMVTFLGYYVPFMILASIIMPIGAGLISTLTVDSGPAKWIGYQVLFGFGAGLGMQQPFIAAQTVFDSIDVPPGTSLLVFLQTLGGALFVSIGQNIFTRHLAAGLAREIPGLDPRMVLNTGATDLKATIAPQYLPAVLEVYNQALVSTFHIAIAMVSLSMLGSLSMEWKNIKEKKVEMARG